MMKIIPIYIVFETPAIIEQSAKDLIKRIIKHLKTDPYALDMVRLGILSYDEETKVIRNLSPIDIEWELDINNLLCPSNYLDPFYTPNFENMVEFLLTKLSQIDYHECPWGPNVFLITNCRDTTMFYRGLNELHTRCKNIEICNINLCSMPRSDYFIDVESLDDIDHIGYRLTNFYEGDFDRYYPKNRIYYKYERNQEI